MLNICLFINGALETSLFSLPAYFVPIRARGARGRLEAGGRIFYNESMGKKTLCIFSFGLKPSQITEETAAAIKGCAEVYCSCLDGQTAKFFSRYCPDIKLSADCSFPKTIKAVLKAFKRRDTVGFLTYGNPLFVHPPTVDLAAAARRRKIQVRIFDAVSSLDSLVNIFGADYTLFDLRLVVASTFHGESRGFFTPQLDTMFFVIYLIACEAGPELRARFIKAAARAYPAHAPAFLAECDSISGKKNIIKGCVGDLEQLLGRANNRHTLFIPAVKGAAGKPGGRLAGKLAISSSLWRRSRSSRPGSPRRASRH